MYTCVMNLLGVIFVGFYLTTTTLEAENVDVISVVLNNGRAKINIDDNNILMEIYHYGETVYSENIGRSLPLTGKPHWKSDDHWFYGSWPSGLQLNISFVADNIPGVLVRWTAPSPEDRLTFTIDLGNYNWYGGSEMLVQSWPIQKVSFLETPFVPNSDGGALERYFLSSGNYAYYIDETMPLFVSLDATVTKTLTFKTSFTNPYRNTDGRALELNFHIVVGTDLVNVHKLCVQYFFGYPTEIPSEKLFRSPIWSTWKAYSNQVNQIDVLKFVEEITDHGFPVAQVEIDDMWEGCYGDETFDPEKFPNPIGMVNSLRLQEIDATLWVHPFVNVNCNTFQKLELLQYLVTTFPENKTGIIQWWNGEAAGVVDVTKSKTLEWWAKRLDKLRNEIGITSFKFDAGETQYLPVKGNYNSSESLQPGIFSTNYVKFASQFGRQIEVRIGYRSQNLPIFVRTRYKDSTWSEVNGLRSVITSSLHLGIIGYPFVLPDMIAGNGIIVDPTEELFIRWVQLNAFLPVMQFSFTPWSFGDEVTSVSIKMIQLHQNISDVFISAARQSTQDGSPIIRPLWWVSPNDTTAQSIDDEFLVGDKYLVAPVLTHGVRERDIYLPKGNWKDEILASEIVGPTWLKSYPVTLEEIPYFSQI